MEFTLISHELKATFDIIHPEAAATVRDIATATAGRPFRYDGSTRSGRDREIGSIDMRIAMLLLVVAGPLTTGSASAQAPYVPAASATAPAAVSEPAALAGKWTYRSFHNDSAPVGDDPKIAPAKAFALIFAEAVFTFEIPSNTTLKGAIDWPGGGLDLQGTIQPSAAGGSPSVQIVGSGRPGTGTAGWEYDYHGQIAYQWPNGINQVPALVGTVIRAKPHNVAPAGYAASFIAVKRP